MDGALSAPHNGATALQDGEIRYDQWLSAIAKQLKVARSGDGCIVLAHANLSQLRALGAALCAFPLKFPPHFTWTIALSGPLGSGKTTLVKALAASLEIDERQVVSPTFAYLQSYVGRLSLHHFDLYRLPSGKDFAEMGFDETLDISGLCCLEWAERLAVASGLSPRMHLQIALKTSRERPDRRHVLIAQNENWTTPTD